MEDLYEALLSGSGAAHRTKDRHAGGFLPDTFSRDQINQSFFSISCVMRTEEMTSYSFISDFILDKDNQVKKLSYSYTSTPKQVVIERSPQHYGTIVFEIDETAKLRLIGEYWTGRKTTGTIDLEFWKKEKLATFPSKLGKHPVSEIRNNRY